MISEEKEDLIMDVITVFCEEYGQKFNITSELRKQIWISMLGEFSEDTIRSACTQVLITHKVFPPTVGEVRLSCIRINTGTIERPKASEAWGRVLKKIQGQKIDLSVDEKRALEQVGTIYDLRRSENQSLSYERTAFQKAFDHIQDEWEREQLTLPQVKALVDKNSKILGTGQPEIPQLESPKPEENTEIPSGEQVRQLIESAAFKMEMKG